MGVIGFSRCEVRLSEYEIGRGVTGFGHLMPDQYAVIPGIGNGETASAYGDARRNIQ